jgi:hypothetical protein
MIFSAREIRTYWSSMRMSLIMKLFSFGMSSCSRSIFTAYVPPHSRAALSRIAAAAWTPRTQERRSFLLPKFLSCVRANRFTDHSMRLAQVALICDSDPPMGSFSV